MGNCQKSPWQLNTPKFGSPRILVFYQLPGVCFVSFTSLEHPCPFSEGSTLAADFQDTVNSSRTENPGSQIRGHTACPVSTWLETQRINPSPSRVPSWWAHTLYKQDPEIGFTNSLQGTECILNINPCSCSSNFAYFYPGQYF